MLAYRPPHNPTVLPFVIVALTLTSGWWPAGAAARAGQVVFEVRESLGRADWYAHSELLSYPFSAPENACHPESVRLQGPNGDVPVQLSGIETWADTPFVKNATIHFIVDRPEALATTTYTLTYGAAARPATTVADTAPSIRIEENGDRAVFTSSRWNCRLYLPLGGQTYDPPVPVTEAPGPFAGMAFGDMMVGGEGGSRLIGDIPVTAWSARVTDRGPVFARAVITYAFADGATLRLTARMAGGDAYVRWETESSEDRPEQELEFRMPRWVGVTEAGLPKGYGQWARDRTLPVTDATEPFANISPNSSLPNIFAHHPAHIRMQRQLGEDRADINFIAHDPGAWVEPAEPLTYAGFKTFDLDMIPKMWERWQRKCIAVSYNDQTPVLRMKLASGRRAWSIGLGGYRLGDRLDRVKDLILDWPAAANDPHPRLFVDRARIEALWKTTDKDPESLRARGLIGTHGLWLNTLTDSALRRFAAAVWNVHMMTSTDAAVSQAARRGLMPTRYQEKEPPDTDSREYQAAVEGVVKHLRDNLRLLGEFDVMRYAIGVAGIYDALIDSDRITPADRALFRAQMAWLAYLMADPQCWDMERGFLTGNPNMSVSYTLSLGIIACALRDHPMAPAWAERATRWMDKWLSDEVGPNGEWIPEGSHYGVINLEPMLGYAIAAKRAGFHDFSKDDRFKRLLLYFAQYHTPPHPQYDGHRVTGAYGRGSTGSRWSVFGIAARLFAETDPAFSRIMQWMWIQNGRPLGFSSFQLGGYEQYVLDFTLPARAPDWHSDQFPHLGILSRHGFNTPNESYLNLLSGVHSRENLDIWAPGVGGIAQWFARGQPLSTCFTFGYGTRERHDLLRDGVRLTHPWAATGKDQAPFGDYTETQRGPCALLPTVDYVQATFTTTEPDARDWFPPDMPAYPKERTARRRSLTWTRQALFLKDPEPAGPAWLLLRDTTRGGQPTVWQFWTLSEKIGTPAQAAQLETFLADQPGAAIVPARELPRGDRYTAIGQFGVDLEFFIVEPQPSRRSPRHTLRYGGVLTGRPEYQDLLHLQLPGDGVYTVALFPRPRAETAPVFSTLARDRMLKVSGVFGTDYVLLASETTDAKAEGATLAGTAAAIQIRETGTTLTVAAAGAAAWQDHGLESASAAALHAAPDGALTLRLPPDHDGGAITLRAPAGYRLHQAPKTVTLTPEQGGYSIAIPAGITTVVLRR